MARGPSVRQHVLSRILMIAVFNFWAYDMICNWCKEILFLHWLEFVNGFQIFQMLSENNAYYAIPMLLWYSENI